MASITNLNSLILDNTFKKYFFEIIKKITKKKYQYYFEKMIHVNKFSDLLKK
jgi:hypothetical protein